MLDLFSGSGSASRAAAVRGWDVVRIDNAPGTAADIRADLSTWTYASAELGRFDLVWASPPCTQLSTAGKARDVEAGLVLVRRALELIRAVSPDWWVLENVHGATRAIGSLIGPPVACYGSFYLWGVFPPFEAKVPRDKTKLSGRRRAERRAAIPWEVSDGLVRACEKLADELAIRAPPGPQRSPTRPRAAPELAPAAAPTSPPPAPSSPPTGGAFAALVPHAFQGPHVDCAKCGSPMFSPNHEPAPVYERASPSLPTSPEFVIEARGYADRFYRKGDEHHGECRGTFEEAHRFLEIDEALGLCERVGGTVVAL